MGSEAEEDQARAANGTVSAGVRNPRARQRALAIGVSSAPADSEPLAELKELLRTAGVATAGEMVQRRPEPDPDRYFGRGKLADLKAEIKAADANLVACDDELLPRQERNLEKELGVPVIDRTAVILDIFADHAHSAEGKLQVELAQLEYNLARMRGLWTHLERLGAGRMDGGIGTRGPGETQIETDRRLARDRIAALRRRLDEVGRTRSTMRARRQRSALPTVALAGYTNAGKSTLLNRLTGAGVSVGDRLFHTLDPTTRAFEHNGRRYLITDTVGFIQKLPHQLVDAFKATLEETIIADLIVHVVDASGPAEDRSEAIAAANGVLEEIGADSAPRVLVYNKLDLLDEDERSRLLVGSRDAVGVSAETGEGIDALMDAIETAFDETLRPMKLLIPYDAGDSLSELHAVAGRLEREDVSEGVRVSARVPQALAHRFEPFERNGDSAVPGDGSDGNGQLEL
ncbi:MAG TPA: GTPase HflX [Solirubrobacterales bacterium]|nr:GTPase HflX [Solirubrobacterales bacterium]